MCATILYNTFERTWILTWNAMRYTTLYSLNLFLETKFLPEGRDSKMPWKKMDLFLRPDHAFPHYFFLRKYCHKMSYTDCGTSLEMAAAVWSNLLTFCLIMNTVNTFLQPNLHKFNFIWISTPSLVSSHYSL